MHMEIILDFVKISPWKSKYGDACERKASDITDRLATWVWLLLFWVFSSSWYSVLLKPQDLVSQSTAYLKAAET